MKTVKINATKLAEVVLENKSLIGDMNYSIWVNEEGKIECGHNVDGPGYLADGWHHFFGMYSFWDDDETLSSTPDELGDWLKYDGMVLNEKKRYLRNPSLDEDEDEDELFVALDWE